MNPSDWTLLVIATATGQCLEPVQLQKSLFLIGQGLALPGFYQFEPYDYGPFSRAIYEDAESLERQGLIMIERPPMTRFNCYSITEAGRYRASLLNATLHPGLQNYVHQMVAWTQQQSFNQLVTSIYDLYPAMKVNSVFREPA